MLRTLRRDLYTDGMAKRKLPPAPNVWARMVDGRDWEIYLPSGETLHPIRTLDKTDVPSLARRIPVFLIAYLSPVKDLSRDTIGIDDALAGVDAKGPEYNTLHLFGSREGTEVVVFDHHH
jgi:hypothetical protein